MLPLTLRSRVSPLIAVGSDGFEPSSGPYKEPALTIELRAQSPHRLGGVGWSEVGGIRTPTVQIKSLLCCRYTTTPCAGPVPAFAAWS